MKRLFSPLRPSQRSPRARLALSLLGLASVGLPARAAAHGDPPAVRGALLQSGQVHAVGLNRGLAVRQGTGWRYVCPSVWAGQPIPHAAVDHRTGELWIARPGSEARQPAAGESPAGQQQIGDGIQVLNASGRWVRSLPLSTGWPLALADGPTAPFVLVQSASGREIWTASSGEPNLQRIGTQPEGATTITAGLRADGAVEVVTGTLLGPTLRLRQWRLVEAQPALAQPELDVALPLPDAVTLTLSLQKGALFAVASSPSSAHIGLIERSDSAAVWRALYAEAPPLSLPVLAAGEVWLVRVGLLGRIGSWPDGPASGVGALVPHPFALEDDRRWYTCLEPGAAQETLACARTQLQAFMPPGLPPAPGQPPRFQIAALQAPEFAELSGSLQYGCWLEWLDLATEAGLDPGRAPGTTPAAETGGGGCAAAPPRRWEVSGAAVGLVALLFLLRLRRSAGSSC